jgi:beta-phosphoglucomutase-like phosphatase (HAD superfamily)
MASRYSRARGVTFEAVTRTGLAVAVVKRVDGVALRKEHVAGKPAPDSYLEGARQLVVGVDRVGQSEALRHHCADVVVTDLAGLLDGE